MNHEAFGEAIAALLLGMLAGYVVFLASFIYMGFKLGWHQLFDLLNPFYDPHKPKHHHGHRIRSSTGRR